MQTTNIVKTAWLVAALSIAGWTTTQAQLATWTGASGGEWNTAANWDIGIVPGALTNALIGSTITANYNIPMSAATFGMLSNKGVVNINANAFTNTSIVMTFPGGTGKLFVNDGGVLDVTGNLGFCSNSIVSMTAGSAVTVGGTLIIGCGTTGGTGSTTVGSSGSFTNLGGMLTANATALNPGNSSVGSSCRLVIEGGTNNLGAYSAQRSPGGNNAAPALGSDGLVLSNGFVNTTSIQLGNNAHGIIYIVGGTMTNTGTFSIANATATRPARFHQVGGLFVNSSVVTMSGAADTVYSVLGGTNIVGGFLFTGNSVFFTNGGPIYVGSAGISSNGTATLTFSLNDGGLFGATTNWIASVPMKLNTGSSGKFTFQTADLNGNPTNIQITGVLSGSGNLNKTGGGTLLLSATNINTGSTLVNGGTLKLDVNGSTTSSKVIVGSGSTFDVSAVTGGFVLTNQTHSGSGMVTGAVSVAVGATIDPGSNTLTGTLSFSNSVTEVGSVSGVINHFDLSGAPSPNNDKVIIAGDFNVSATNTVDISGASLVSGTNYVLIQYGGNFNGGITNFKVTTAIGTLTNDAIAKTISFIPQSTLRGPASTVWIGNPVNTNWDNEITTNWLNAGALDFFVPSDSVQFTDAGASNSPVNIIGTVLPTAVLVNSHSNYVIASTSGDKIGGTATLTVTNTGTLTILTTNSYSGVTTIDGGSTLAVSQLANGLAASAIGASASDAANLVINNGTFNYTGPTVSIDRGATFGNASSAVNVSANGDLTLGGGLVGGGGLTKAGPGTLTLNGASSFAGVTTLSNGTLQVSGTSSLGANNVNFDGGTLTLANNGSQQFYANVFNVPATGTLICNGGNGNNIIGTSGGTGSITGTGTSILNVKVSATNGILTINEDLGGFAGTIHLTDDTLGTFRLNSGGGAGSAQQCTGGTNLTLDLGNGSVIFVNRNGGNAAFGNYYFGALKGGTNTLLRGAASSGNTSTYNIGFLNTSTAYAGSIQNGTAGTASPQASAAVSIVKVGTGTLTLLGQNSYSGSTTVSNGVLALAYNPTNSNDATINNSAVITVTTGAFLDVSARSDQTLQLGGTFSQQLRGRGTINGILNVGGSGTVSPGGGIGGDIGTLTVTNTITLGGTAWMKLNRAGGPNSDQLVSGATINYGGTLVVTNIGAPLQVGDTFTNFIAPSLNGSASSFTLDLPRAYVWDTSKLGVNGSIKVAGMVTPPTISKVVYTNFANGILIFYANYPNATNYSSDSISVNILTSTNLAAPLSSWTVVGNGIFDDGTIVQPPGQLIDPSSVTPGAIATVNTNLPNSFFILQWP
jgi:autotransporter-associated beta strand protein